MEISVTALVLALLGLAESIYFTLAYYGRVRESPLLLVETRRPPTVREDDDGTCTSLLRTPEAKVLGLPNSLFGVCYYLLVIAASGYRMAYGAWPVRSPLIGAACLATLMSLYLGYALLFRLRVACVLCFTAQAINAVILVLVLVG